MWFLSIRAFSCRTSSASCSKSPSTNAVLTKFHFFMNIVCCVAGFPYSDVPLNEVKVSVENENNNASVGLFIAKNPSVYLKPRSTWLLHICQI